MDCNKQVVVMVSVVPFSSSSYLALTSLVHVIIYEVKWNDELINY